MTLDNVTVGSWWHKIASEKGYVDPNLGRPKNNDDKKERKLPCTTNQIYITNLKRTKETCIELIKKFSETEDIEKFLDKKQLQFIYHE